MRFSTFAIAAFAASVSTQSASQIAQCDALAAQIPACVLPCDDAGFQAVGCTATDYACHCVNGAKLATIIPSCLKNSTCSSTDLQTFSTIPAEICAVLNSTASTNSTSSANSTSTTTLLTGSGSATATPAGPKTSGSATGSGVNAVSTGGAGALNVASTVFTVVGMGILGLFL